MQAPASNTLQLAARFPSHDCNLLATQHLQPPILCTRRINFLFAAGTLLAALSQHQRFSSGGRLDSAAMILLVALSASHHFTSRNSHSLHFLSPDTLLLELMQLSSRSVPMVLRKSVPDQTSAATPSFTLVDRFRLVAIHVECNLYSIPTHDQSITPPRVSLQPHQTHKTHTLIPC